MTQYRNHQHEIDSILANRRPIAFPEIRSQRDLDRRNDTPAGMGWQPLLAIASITLTIGICIGAAI